MAIYSDDTSSSKINNSQELSYLNILSIDFDWVMEPSIAVYNNLPELFTDDLMWSTLADIAPDMKFPMDYTKYYALVRLLCNKWNVKVPIYVYDDHKRIMDLFNTVNKKPYYLYNIDHHHDLGYYHGDDIPLQHILSTAENGNWASHYLMHPNCKQYVWVRDTNSFMNTPPALNASQRNFTSTTEIRRLDDKTFDFIFICLSPSFVPPVYYPLFEALIKPFEKYINI